MGGSVLIPASSNKKPLPAVRGAGQSFPLQHSTDVTPALAPKIPPNMQELQLMGVRVKELTPLLMRTKIFEGSAEITAIERLQELYNHKCSDDVWKKEPSNSGFWLD